MTKNLNPRLPDGYIPIYFSPEWIREKYQRWEMIDSSNHHRVLAKPDAPGLSRVLILGLGLNESTIYLLTQLLRRFLVSPRILIHDFSPQMDGLSVVRGAQGYYSPVDASQRWLNSKTLIVDLRQSEESLWSQVHNNAQGAVKKARNLNYTAEWKNHLTRDELTEFCHRHEKMCIERGLRERLNILELEKMSQGGNLILGISRNPSQEMMSMSLFYRTQDQGFYLHGVSAADRSVSLGQFLHWETMRWMKSQGITWFDLGGIPVDPSHGITKYKKSLGGIETPLAAEWMHESPVYKLISRLRPSRTKSL